MTFSLFSSQTYENIPHKKTYENIIRCISNLNKFDQVYIKKGILTFLTQNMYAIKIYSMLDLIN